MSLNALQTLSSFAKSIESAGLTTVRNSLPVQLFESLDWDVHDEAVHKTSVAIWRSGTVDFKAVDVTIDHELYRDGEPAVLIFRTTPNDFNMCVANANHSLVEKMAVASEHEHVRVTVLTDDTRFAFYADMAEKVGGNIPLYQFDLCHLSYSEAVCLNHLSHAEFDCGKFFSDIANNGLSETVALFIRGLFDVPTEEQVDAVANYARKQLSYCKDLDKSVVKRIIMLEADKFLDEKK